MTEEKNNPFEDLDRHFTNFSMSEKTQKLFTKNVVDKFWTKIDETIDVDELVYNIISDLEFSDYLVYNEEQTDDKDSLRDMVLTRLAYHGYYEDEDEDNE